MYKSGGARERTRVCEIPQLELMTTTITFVINSWVIKIDALVANWHYHTFSLFRVTKLLSTLSFLSNFSRTLPLLLGFLQKASPFCCGVHGLPGLEGAVSRYLIWNDLDIFRHPQVSGCFWLWIWQTVGFHGFGLMSGISDLAPCKDVKESDNWKSKNIIRWKGRTNSIRQRKGISSVVLECFGIGRQLWDASGNGIKNANE